MPLPSQEPNVATVPSDLRSASLARLSQSSPSSPLSTADAIKLLIVLIVAAAMCLMVEWHVPGMNGSTRHWSWPWVRFEGIKLYPSMLMAAAGFVVGQYLYARRARAGLAIAALMVGCLSLQLVNAGHHRIPFSMSHIHRVIEHHLSTSYYTDAKKFMQSEMSTGEFIRKWPEHAHAGAMHTRTRPPGWILCFGGLIALFGSTGHIASAIGGYAIALLATLCVPATYLLTRYLGRERDAAFCAASYMTLTPSLILFCPTIDQVYPVATVGLILLWAYALDADRSICSLMFGLVLGVVLFFTYNFLVLGFFLACYAALALYEKRVKLARIGRHIAIGAVGLVLPYLFLWLATRFNPFVMFAAALVNQETHDLGLDRPYPYTIPWDLFDFSLGTAWISFILVGYFFLRRWEPAVMRRAVLCVAQILVVVVTGLLRSETARVWMFLMPLMMVPIGLELSRWNPRARWAVYAAVWSATCVIGVNMLFKQDN